MRLAGRERLGFYPLPIAEAERICRLLVFPEKPCCALDPCVGDGVAFAEITSNRMVIGMALNWKLAGLNRHVVKELRCSMGTALTFSAPSNLSR
jgi:hypothetical protein